MPRDILEALDFRLFALLEDSANGNVAQPRNAEKLPPGRCVEVDGKIFGMQPGPVLFRIDIQRQVPHPVKADFRFGKSVFAQQKIALVQPMLAHQHVPAIPRSALFEEAVPQPLLLGAAIAPVELPPGVQSPHIADYLGIGFFRRADDKLSGLLDALVFIALAG